MSHLFKSTKLYEEAFEYPREDAFSKQDVESITYGLSLPNADNVVILTQKFTLKNSEEYGKTIAIPLEGLQSLLEDLKTK